VGIAVAVVAVVLALVAVAVARGERGCREREQQVHLQSHRADQGRLQSSAELRNEG
jgi:hypothetical protein